MFGRTYIFQKRFECVKNSLVYKLHKDGREMKQYYLIERRDILRLSQQKVVDRAGIAHAYY